MISRHWRGLANPARADEYVQHLRSDTLPKLSNIPGFISASILRRNITQGVEFLVVTNWESIGAIEQFSGRDPEAGHRTGRGARDDARLRSQGTPLRGLGPHIPIMRSAVARHVEGSQDRTEEDRGESCPIAGLPGRGRQSCVWSRLRFPSLMKPLSVALLVALAAGPGAVQADDDPTALPQATDRPDTSSVVLTPQGVRRQAPTPISGNPSPPKSDAGRPIWAPARSTLMDLATSIACTSMFALRPDTQGTDPAASAGR